jgi:hypothetical protein
MKATQNLPQNYSLYEKLTPVERWRRTHWIVWILGLAVAGLSFILLNRLAVILRPDFQPNRLHFEVPTLQRLKSILLLTGILILVGAVHELIHGVVLWIFTGQWPTLAIGGGGIAVRLPSWFVPRYQMLAANLAPFLVMTLAGLILLMIAPLDQLSLVVFFTALNMAGSISDITGSIYMSLHSPSTYIRLDNLTIYTDKNLESPHSSSIKSRIRSLVENVIAWLDPEKEPG